MKIVLIEADESDRSAIRTTLEQRNETVFAFSDGKEAWCFIEESADIDIIIVSLNSETKSGLEICWYARILAEQRKAMYVIAISERDKNDLLVEALDSGADDYLQKPLHDESLLARLRVAERMILLQQQLVKLANHDPLTDLYNRRAFFELANRKIRERSEGSYLSAIMFDIDHFKSVNDKYGHDAGDEVIRIVARIAAREGELLGRHGGEEFALILEDQSFLQTARTADRIRIAIEQTPIVVGGHTISITSSFGVAQYHEGESVDDLLKRADIALYRSKHNGRNKVSIEQKKQDERPSRLKLRKLNRA